MLATDALQQIIEAITEYEGTYSRGREFAPTVKNSDRFPTMLNPFLNRFPETTLNSIMVAYGPRLQGEDTPDYWGYLLNIDPFLYIKGDAANLARFPLTDSKSRTSLRSVWLQDNIHYVTGKTTVIKEINNASTIDESNRLSLIVQSKPRKTINAFGELIDVPPQHCGIFFNLTLKTGFCDYHIQQMVNLIRYILEMERTSILGTISVRGAIIDLDNNVFRLTFSQKNSDPMLIVENNGTITHTEMVKITGRDDKLSSSIVNTWKDINVASPHKYHIHLTGSFVTK
jgi:hypothetical protein